MKRKSNILLSSITACAIFASAFAFNVFAVDNVNAQSYNLPSSVLSKCPKTTNTTQNANNQLNNIKSADINSMLQSIYNRTNCNKTNAKNTNYSAFKSQLDSLLRSNYGTSATKPASNAVASKPTCNKASTKPTTAPAATPAPKPTTAPTATPAPKPTTAPTATPAPKPTTAPATGAYSAYQNKILELVNVERANNGLKPLTMNATLSKTATLKSQDMAKLNYFDHNSPTYGSPFEMMKTYGITYRSAGENIAMGQTSPEQVMQGWMNSPGHRANILNSSFTQLGVGVATDSNGRIYWTQQFIG